MMLGSLAGERRALRTAVRGGLVFLQALVLQLGLVAVSTLAVSTLAVSTLPSAAYATDPDDGRWSGQFAISGIDGTVECAVMNGPDLIVGGTFSHAGGVAVHNVARWDGANWSALGAGDDNGLNNTVYALAVYGGSLYAGGIFMASGNGSTPLRGIARWTGTSWTPVLGGISSGGAVFALTLQGGNLIVGGTFSEVGSPPQLEDNIAAWNGTSWVSLAGGLDKIVRALAVYNGEIVAGGYFLDRLVRFNGTSWARVGNGFDPLGGIEALTVWNSKLYVGGSFSAVNGGNTPAANVAVWDGAVFAPLGAGCGVAEVDTVYALSVSGTRVIAGGNFLAPAQGLVGWDGAAYSPLGAGVTGTVHAFADAGAQLYVAGQFRENSTGTQNLVRWSAPGGPFSRLNQSQAVDAVVTHLGNWNNRLVVGGQFDFAGSQAAHGIALFDGTGMAALGTGLVGNLGAAPAVYASISFNTELVIGGEFSQAGGVAVSNLARWNGTAWSPLGVGFNDRVTDLEVYGGQLVAAGRFTQAYDQNTNVRHLARWDGAHWQPVGNGVTGGSETVNALALYNGELIAAGSFSSAGGGPANRIARWNGTTWAALGAGVNGPVTSLAVLGTELYAGGLFTTAGGASIPYLAKWNGVIWSAVGGPADSPVLSLLSSGGKLYAGGYFSLIGSTTAANIAVWYGGAWTRMASGTDGDVQALAYYKDGIYAGGVFTHAGSKPSVHLGRWTVGATAVGEPAPSAARFALSPAWPNPFRSATTIRFDLPMPGPVQLSVFDAQGRLMAPPRATTRPAGAQALTWDGRDADGAPLAPGVYFVRVETSFGAAAQKVVLQP